MTKRKAARWILVAAMLGYVTFLGVRAWERRTDGFTVEKMHSDLPYDPAWDIKVSQEELANVNKILNQPYRYLGHGFQCYAFLSEDGTYVLKFMRHQRLRPPVMFDWLPNIAYFQELKKQKTQERFSRMQHLFRGFKVGFEYVPEQTGLVFLHLNKTQNQHPTIAIYDKSGAKHEIDLDKTEFVLQRKALLIKPVIIGLMNSGKVDEAKERINQIFALLVECSKRGIQDMDGALIRKDNLGFLGSRAIYIDSGKLSCKESIRQKARFVQDLHRLRPLHKWLSESYPELAKHFEVEKKRVIDAF
ncbi:MAG: hypothetical protein JSR46_11715 [Verrucomicrobia bacterium]|nr:hypothetical protein [Verrucomicrobiota bacterium]